MLDMKQSNVLYATINILNELPYPLAMKRN